MQHVEVSAPLGGVVERERGGPYQAYQLLHWGFVAVPTIAGLDKFTNLLCRWTQFLAPQFARLSPLGPAGTMKLVGVIEVVAALLVALRPRVGAYVVAAWLAGIIVSLLLCGGYYDIVLRDVGLAVAALALGRLASRYDVGRSGRGRGAPAAATPR